MIRKTIILLIFAQMILLSMAIFFSQPVVAQSGEPTVNIALLEQSTAADVGPGDTGECKFNGVVSVTMNKATRVIVNLSAEDTWDSAVVSPPSIEFTRNGDKKFVVMVWAPLGANFTDTGLVTVFGNWTASPGNYSGKANPISGAAGRIDIHQFFDFNLSSPKSYFEAKQGNMIALTLTIHNLGNFMDTFSIEILNDEELNKKNIEVILTQSLIEILQKPANESLCIKIRILNDAKTGEHDIKVQVTSHKGIEEGVPAQIYIFTVKVTRGTGPSSIPTGLELASILCLVLLIGWTIGRKKSREI